MLYSLCFLRDPGVTAAKPVQRPGDNIEATCKISKYAGWWPVSGINPCYVGIAQGCNLSQGCPLAELHTVAVGRNGEK